MKFGVQMRTDILLRNLVVILGTLIHIVSSIEIDNGLAGKVFVKGHYTNPSCKVDYSLTREGRSPKETGGIVIRHGECDMERQRMISPQGMQFSTVVIVSFHPTFITKVDRAFHIKCMYRELDKTVGSNLEVSMLTTQVIGHEVPMPVCQYSIRKDEIDGEVLRYARVGEQVVHRWECETDVYGILVHSCYVEDGQGEKIEVIDDRGCHVDQYLLSDPTYVKDLNMAYRESHVFKFADRVSVRFQCQIRLCMKEDDGCRGITPPNFCPGNRRLLNEPPFLPRLDQPSLSDYRFLRGQRNRRTFSGSMRERRAATSNFTPVDGDFKSQFIYVLDSAETRETTDPEDTDQLSVLSEFLERVNNAGAIVSGEIQIQNSVCLSSLTFTILLVSVTIVLLAATFVAATLCCQKLPKCFGIGSQKSDMVELAGSSKGGWYDNAGFLKF